MKRWQPARAWPPSFLPGSACWTRAPWSGSASCFGRLKLPVSPPPAEPGQFLAAMGMDKKVVAGQIRLVLLDGIGRPGSRATMRPTNWRISCASSSCIEDGQPGTPSCLVGAHESRSRGRLYPEPAHPYRGEYQRDRDRIVHSSGFRRLVYKTQVFVNHEGDLYRTRLTHSLEVAQIGRTVARCLGLNGELVEAIALAHDLGHTPFGHAGEDALDACMKAWGGFEHNLQSLRVVDELEQRYTGFPGLNLCFETREGILKHCSKRNARQLGDVGERFLNRAQPGLEAQVANLADEIAYNNHDVDDGLRSGLLSEAALCSVPLFRRHHEPVVRTAPHAPRRVLIHETIRAMINEVVTDLVTTSRRNIAASRVRSGKGVRALNRPLITLSPASRPSTWR